MSIARIQGWIASGMGPLDSENTSKPVIRVVLRRWHCPSTAHDGEARSSTVCRVIYSGEYSRRATTPASSTKAAKYPLNRYSTFIIIYNSIGDRYTVDFKGLLKGMRS